MKYLVLLKNNLNDFRNFFFLIVFYSNKYLAMSQSMSAWIVDMELLNFQNFQNLINQKNWYLEN